MRHVCQLPGNRWGTLRFRRTRDKDRLQGTMNKITHFILGAFNIIQGHLINTANALGINKNTTNSRMKARDPIEDRQGGSLVRRRITESWWVCRCEGDQKGRVVWRMKIREGEENLVISVWLGLQLLKNCSDVISEGVSGYDPGSWMLDQLVIMENIWW